MNYYVKALKQYADFNGRASRKEYWMFFLFNMIFAVVASVLDGIIGSVGIIYGLYILATLVPSLAAGVRRLHDSGKSGWMMLVSLIPFIGGIWLLILLVAGSQEGDNEYGPQPE